MPDTRHKNATWNLGNPISSVDHANLGVLMDIRDELQSLNRIFGCYNFTSLPQVLREIRDALKRVQCPKCGKYCKNQRGVTIHQSKELCR